MIRRRRQLSAEGTLLLLIVLFVFLAVVYPAVTVLTSRKTETSEKPDVEINVDATQYVNVYIGGEIKEMQLEDYLVGVVAAEMPASYEMEALKAQAVAARTYTMYKKKHGGCSEHSGADICTDSAHCQAYATEEELAALWGDDTDKYLEKIRQAVNATSGQEVYYQGEEIQVFYHACSGGETEDCANVYGESLPYLVSVQSEGEEDYSKFYGEVAVGFEDFISAMQKFSPSIKIDKNDIASCIGDIVRFESGRVESIKIGNESFTGREVRGIFSLNSANFTIKVSGNDIVFDTIGYGHGVGMSQTGANAMAKKGADYIEILTHYFTGVTVE